MGRSFRTTSRSVAMALGCVAFGPALFVQSDALALQPSSATVGRPEFELPSGNNGAIPRRIVSDRAPRDMLDALRSVSAEMGGDFRASFNPVTGVPSRLFGRGASAPGTISSATKAARFAERFLERNIAALAPSAHVSDFEVVSNDLDASPRGDGLPVASMRTVGFQQFYVTRGGHRLEVRGGQVSFRFKNDALVLIGSEALPMGGVVLDVPETSLSDASIAKAASGFVAKDFGAPTVVGSVSPLFVLPFSNDNGALDFRIVRSVVVEVRSSASHAVSARFEVFVDAQSGSAVAREELLRFGSATLDLHATTRSPSYGPRVDQPAIDATLIVDANGNKTDTNGLFSFLAPVSNVTAFSHGPDVNVVNQGGNPAQIGFQIADGSTFVWDASTDEIVDAELDAFVHARQVREYARSFAPTLDFLNDQVSVFVNIDDTCNAYSDGTIIHFYKSGGGCENTGRIADVVYHEYGHSIHNHAIIPGVGFWEGALSEGIADYLACTMTGDSGMGRGFYFTDAPLRELDPQDHKAQWPDDLVGEVHEDGKIIAQTLWELRKELVDKLGPAGGVAQANDLFYQGIRRAVDIPSMYPEVLVADDDDGNLENGTPNVCEINRSFALHGLRPYSADSSQLSLEPAHQDGYQVSTKVHRLFSQCPDDALTSATIAWRNEVEQEMSGTVTMQINGSQLSGTIPEAPERSVVQYSVAAAFAGTEEIDLPDNRADPLYQFYVGDVTPLYCTDFETDPAKDGWTHGLTIGSATTSGDDWEWGIPKGTASNGDPTAAFSGKKVFGNDLGDLPNHDGLYQADKTSFALSPIVDTTGYDIVRLQYRRWLTVEDGHFDQASIYANGKPAWQNADSHQGESAAVDHVDKEWRFHDVDLSQLVKDDHVQVKFELNSDPSKQLGGWNIDDFCVVGVKSGLGKTCVGSACPGAGGSGVGGDGAGGSPSNDGVAGHGCNCIVDSTDETEPSRAAWMILGALALLTRLRRRSAS